MALGGSITAGVTDALKQLPHPGHRGGYREPLMRLLAADGYEVDFVGSQALGQGIQAFDPDHEAHPRWTIAQLAYGRRGDGSDGVYGWLAAQRADVVLLQLDAAHLATGPASVEAILSEIDRWEASPAGNPVTVVVSGVLGQAPAVQSFNRALQAMIARRASDDVIVLNHAGALVYPDHFGDRLHPNTVGYRKLAKLWRDALIDHQLLTKCRQ
jgi:hypothetical protein